MATPVIVFFDAKSTALDGKPYVNTCAWFPDMRDGKVIAASVFFDSIESTSRGPM